MSCWQVPETQTPRRFVLQHLGFPPFSSIYPPGVRGSPRSFATRLFSLGRTGSFPLSIPSDYTADRAKASPSEGQQSADGWAQRDLQCEGDRRDDGETEDGKGKKNNLEGTRQEMVEDDELVYEAESPDEAALVHAAHVYGFTLRGRSADHVLVDLPGIGSVVVQLLHILPFDSNRRRMSVVVRHPLSGQVVVYTKGADSVIMDLSKNPKGKILDLLEIYGELLCANSVLYSLLCLDLSQDQEVHHHIREQTQKHLDSYARDGLRTLCIAKKVTLQI